MTTKNNFCRQNMKKEDLYKKYGKKLIDDIITKGYLEGCTITINEDRTEDIPEVDIKMAIKEINGEKIGNFEWD